MTSSIARRESQLQAAPDPIDAVANLPRDIAIIKMDNDSMIAMAAARPRDYGEIVEEIKNQLSHFKSFAVSAMYAKPVGKMDKCPSCGAQTFYKDRCPGCGAEVPQKIARGLSIRAAEALAVAYKYNRIDVEPEDIEGGEKVRLTCSFVDYQTGRVVRDSIIVSKSYKTRNGQTQRIPDDRFYDVVLKAKKSILIRDCIMKMIPPGMRSELETCVEEQLAQFLDENTVTAIVANFSQKNVSPEMLERYFGKRLNSLTKDDRLTLASMWTGLKDGETTVDELFGSGKPEIAPPQKKQPEQQQDTTPPSEPDSTQYDALSSVQGADIGNEYNVKVAVETIMHLTVGKDKKDKTSLRISDQSHALECSAWGKHELAVGDVITGTIKVGEYQGRPQYTLGNIAKA
jgi:hypothetical protein